MRNEDGSPVVDVRHLRLVDAITEQGSMTAAARTLNLTQPALSHQLRELEARLRVPLFMRTPRRMVPTEAGAQLAELARSVLPRLSAFERETRDGEFATVHGEVRIATECYTAYHWLPPVLRAFGQRWPNLELRVRPEHTSAPFTALREGALDLAIVFTAVEDRRLDLKPLFDDELVIVTARDHKLAGRPFVSVQALRDERFFIYTSPDSDSTIARDILRPAGVKPSQITRLQLTEAIIELVSANLGIAILARWAVVPAVRAGAVQALRLGRKGITRTWYTAVRNTGVTPAWQFDLIELLRRNLGNGPRVRAASS
jgi:LysR family transcriptional regulator for metE and metH